MRDKRPVDELTIEELERVLAMKKREERQKRMQKMRRDGRVVDNSAQPPALAEMPPAFVPPMMPAEPSNSDGAPANGTNGDTPEIMPYRAEASPNGAGPSFEDEPYDPLDDFDGKKEHERAWRRFVNGLLLVVEVCAVLGLVGIGVNLVQTIGKLESETANAAAIADQQRRAGIPTLAPTPVLTLQAVVLPTGHTFTPSGAPQFNYDEIPQHLLALVQDQIIAPPPRRPPPTDDTPLRLIIPKLNVDQTIVQGVDWEALKLGIGQMQNGATPNADVSNVVLAAHNDIYGEYFRHLDQLESGDQFQIQTRGQIYNYTVSSFDIVAPTDVSVMDARGGPTATLISCYPYQVNSQRIVVFATRDT
jgi:sortase A